MAIGKHKKIWIDRYGRIRDQRNQMFKAFTRPEIEAEWLTTRPNKHQWAVDEIIRHLLFSEIRYVQQSFDPTRSPHPAGLRAAWEEDIVEELEEGEHIEVKDLKKMFPPVEVATEELLREAADMDFERTVKAPWGAKLRVFKLLNDWYDHEQYHRGQAYFVLHYFQGPTDY